MTDHYYTNQPTSRSDPRYFETNLLGSTYQFKTDSGVFSKERIDYGSEVLIRAVSEEELSSGDLLDIGCGYGPIGISLANEFRYRTIHMVDINERAIDLAKANVETNEISNVSIYSSSLFEQVEKEDFAAIISNPPNSCRKENCSCNFRRIA